MFASQVKYKTAVRLAVKAWMVFVETGSVACKRAHLRCMKLAKSLQVPSGALRAELWIDVEHHQEYLARVNASYIACGMPVVVSIG